MAALPLHLCLPWSAPCLPLRSLPAGVITSGQTRKPAKAGPQPEPELLAYPPVTAIRTARHVPTSFGLHLPSSCGPLMHQDRQVLAHPSGTSGVAGDGASAWPPHSDGLVPLSDITSGSSLHTTGPSEDSLMTGSLPGLSGATMGAGATSSPARDKSTTADTAAGRSKQQKRKAPAVSSYTFSSASDVACGPLLSMLPASVLAWHMRRCCAVVGASCFSGLS